jgi:hypothetical protein
MGSTMVHALADELIRVVDAAASGLRAIDPAVAAAKRAPDVWSVKEIIGHLVDSAANNHQRFIRAQIEGRLTFPAYQQEDWVRLGDHQGRDWNELVSFWQAYNHQLAHVIRRIPAERLDVHDRRGRSGQTRVPAGGLPPAPSAPLGAGRRAAGLIRARGSRRPAEPPAR